MTSEAKFEPLTRGEQLRAAACGLVGGGALVVGVLSVFAIGGQSPWFDDDSQWADAALRCQANPYSSQRHQCLRTLADAAALGASAPRHVAAGH
ncbi:hypothetical protein [Rivibacter subsaxonicus]|uniref:Conjugative transfer region protein TrbK n=1 Tax=Rivibacter subsaxonicus TaxID=457575 RepID=A0A4Q7VH19_9BURK|nr:hypothetical protein [Rivibacter subsaxonicus]RZT95360.1 hypothetical protein EV670_3115 [Rivibacter subsaxonicus]